MGIHNPVHPGAIVREDCLKPLGLSVTQGARHLGVGRQTLSNLVNGKTAIPSKWPIACPRHSDPRRKPGWGCSWPLTWRDRDTLNRPSRSSGSRPPSALPVSAPGPCSKTVHVARPVPAMGSRPVAPSRHGWSRRQPGRWSCNRLGPLRGDHARRRVVRVNEQWRLCLVRGTGGSAGNREYRSSSGAAANMTIDRQARPAQGCFP